MNDQKYLYGLILCILILMFIFPFFYITRYTSLTADDFCRTSIDFTNYAQNFPYWYRNITGRYTNYFLSYLPIYSENLYRLSLMLLFSSLGVSIFYFVKGSLEFLKWKNQRLSIMFLSTLFFITLISQLPSIFEYFYWYASSTVYLISTIFFLLFVFLLFKLESKNRLYLPTICFLIICMNGNNEMLILLTNFILFSLLIWRKIRIKVLSNRLLIANVVAILSGLIVVLSPATENRQGYFSNSGDIIFSIWSSLLSSGMFILKSTVEFPYIIFYLGLFIFFNHYIKKFNSIKTIGVNPILLIVWSFLALGTVFFVPYYGTGSLNVNLGRIGNMIHVIFLIIIYINVFNAALFFKKVKLNFQFQPVIYISMFALYLTMILIYNINYKNILLDLANNSFEQYQLKIENRIIELENFKGDHLILNRIEGTRTLPHWEISSNASHWSNECYLDYLKNQYHLNAKTVIIEEKILSSKK